MKGVGHYRGLVHFEGVHLGFLSHLECSAKKAIVSTPDVYPVVGPVVCS